MTEHYEDTMTPEKLSQLMDGEWQDIDPADCVARTCGDEALRANWNRWHLIRDIVRGESVMEPEQVGSLASRIQGAIAAEATYSNVRTIHGGPAVVDAVHDDSLSAEPAAVPERDTFAWKQFAAGGALAASVALATVFGLDILGSPDNSQTGALSQVASLDAPSGIPVPTVGVDDQGIPVVSSRLADVDLVSHSLTGGDHWVSAGNNGEMQRSAAEDRLNFLLMEHLEQSFTSQRVGLLPYSSLVGYDAAPSETTDSR